MNLSWIGLIGNFRVLSMANYQEDRRLFNVDSPSRPRCCGLGSWTGELFKCQFVLNANPKAHGKV